MGSGREWITSPCSDGRVSVTLLLAFSSFTSLPEMKSTKFAGSPEEATVNGVRLAPPRVCIVRFTAQVGVVSVVGGLLPLRFTSAAAPFSTKGPSGESENLLSMVGHEPDGTGVTGTFSQ